MYINNLLVYMTNDEVTKLLHDFNTSLDGLSSNEVESITYYTNQYN